MPIGGGIEMRFIVRSFWALSPVNTAVTKGSYHNDDHWACADEHECYAKAINLQSIKVRSSKVNKTEGNREIVGE